MRVIAWLKIGGYILCSSFLTLTLEMQLDLIIFKLRTSIAMLHSTGIDLALSLHLRESAL